MTHEYTIVLLATNAEAGEAHTPQVRSLGRQTIHRIHYADVITVAQRFLRSEPLADGYVICCEREAKRA